MVAHGDINASALAEHVLNSGHEIDWDNVTLLGQNSHSTSSHGIYNIMVIH